MLYQLSYQSDYKDPAAPPRVQKLFRNAKLDRSIGVSIPVPRACKARTLPIELMPLKGYPVRSPGIEPGSSAWEAPMITITLRALYTPGGDRTRDPRLIRPVLYR